MGNTAAKRQYCLVGKREEHDQEENGSSSISFTCGICMETMSQEQMFKKKNCSHPFCLDCMSKHILYKVRGRNAQVRCPHVGCTKLLDPLRCRPILAVDTFVRWCDEICKEMAIRSPYAYCPFRDCSAMVLDECKRKGAVTKVECPSCKRGFCFQCRVPWHEGYRCGEAGIRMGRDEEPLNELAKKKRWKRCPNCSVYVELTSGCSVVTCRCKNLFCYRCGAKHTLIHSFTCPCLWSQ